MRDLGTVQIKTGAISGFARDGITCYAGIPYAAPPVGALRWRRPQDPAPWTGVRACTTGGNMSWQRRGMVGHRVFEQYAMDEDCLYLNVWTPARSPAERLPVLVWVHGGGFQGGTGNERLYEGWRLAANGIVVVNLNYRLGPFGFFAHPALSAEYPQGVSGNYGLFDVLKALEWVKANIAALGGDPARITVAGQSAGGAAVCALLGSPLSAGLISGAIIQSGGPGVLREGGRLADAEAYGVRFMEAAGCATIDDLRALEPEQILEVQVDGQAGGMGAFRPIIDGYLSPGDPYRAFVAGGIARVPVMFGSTSAESFYGPRGAAGSLLEYMAEDTGAAREEILALYPELAQGAERVRPGRDRGFALLRHVARRMEAAHPCPVYHYYFGQGMDIEGGCRQEAGHSSDLFYMFGQVGLQGWSVPAGDSATFTPLPRREDYVLSDAMVGYWSAFTRGGDPNAPGLPEWPAYAAESDLHMHLCGDHPVAERSQYPEQMSFWEGVFERQGV